MNSTSVFLRISEFVLVEYIYNTDLISESLHPFNLYNNANDNSKTIVNRLNSKEVTGNTEHLLYAETNSGYKAVVDVNSGFYYPNFDNKVSGSLIPVSTSLLQYDTIRFHIRSGYNFQDNSGFLANLYLEDGNGNKFNLLSQSFFKRDLTVIKYNELPLRISGVPYDKYVEYKVLSTSEILNPLTNNYSFINNISQIKPNPIIFFEFNIVDNINTDQGFIKMFTSFKESTFITTSDSYNLLSANIEEKGTYFQYYASWNNDFIEDFIYSLNSQSGNDYIVEHEIALYEQRGTEFYLTEKFNRSQIGEYDKPLKYRPVISNLAEVSIQLEYVIRLYNRADGSSITKTSSVNSTNINAYSIEPFRLSVQEYSPIKVYNKVVRNNINLKKQKTLLDNKVIVPLYFDSTTLSVDEENKELQITPFDNVYEISVVQKIDGQRVPKPLELNITYFLVFIGANGQSIRIEEKASRDKINGILRFVVSGNTAKAVLKSKNKRYYVNTGNSESFETNVVTGSWVEKGKKVKDDSLIKELEENIKIIRDNLEANTNVKSTVPTTATTTEEVVVDPTETENPNQLQDFVTEDVVVVKPSVEDSEIDNNEEVVTNPTTKILFPSFLEAIEETLTKIRESAGTERNVINKGQFGGINSGEEEINNR